MRLVRVSAALRQKGRRTPASIAAATPSGIMATRRPSGLIAPVRMTSTPASAKAATACAMLVPLVAASSAAPGVDQASTTGTRVP